MKKLKLTNLYYKKRANHFDVYYRYKVKGDQMSIRIGSSSDTVSLLKSRYQDIQSRLWAEKHGLAPAVQDPKPVVKKVLFRDIYTKFVADVEDNHGFSWKRDLFNFKTFVEFFGQLGDWIGGKPGVAKTCEIDLTAIGHKDLERFFKHEAKGYSKSTVNCRHKYIRPLYKWLCREGYLDTNHYDNHDKLNIQDDSWTYQSYSREQILQIISLAETHEQKVLWTIMAYTGLAPIDAGKLSKTEHLVSTKHFNCIVTKRTKTRVMAQMPICGELDELGDLIFGLNLTKSQRDECNTAFVKIVRTIGITERNGYKIAQYGLRHSFISMLKPFLSDNEMAVCVGHQNPKQSTSYLNPEILAIHQKVANVLANKEQQQ